MSGKAKISQDQSGMVSFLVTMILMAVITLIVIGFTQLTSRNSREALDRQLSAQAFYAAESGVNVVRDTIQADIDSTGVITGQTQCSDTHYPTASIAAGVKYTCVLVDPSPTSLVYNNVTQQDSILIPLEAATDFESLNFSWTKKTSGTPVGACATTTQLEYYYPAAASWNCGYGILRVDLMKKVVFGSPNDYSDQIWSNTNTLYLSPYGNHSGQTSLGATAMPFGVAQPKGYYGSGCNSAPGTVPCSPGGACNTYCTVDIRLSGSNQYYARVTMLYNDAAKLTVTGTVAGGIKAEFLNAQSLVDVTGQAQDQLRRIQVRLASDNVTDSSDVPLNALTSTASVCKRFTVAPGGSANPANLCTP